MFWLILIRTIVGAIIGYFVGLFLTRVMFTIKKYRLERRWKRQQKQFEAPFAR